MIKIPPFLKAPVPMWYALGFTFVGYGTGLAVSHVLTKRHFEATFQARLDEEIAGTKKFYGSLAEKPDLDDLVWETDVTTVTTIIEEEGYITAKNADGDVIFEPDLESGEYTEITHNVFSDTEYVWDEDEEDERRASGKPYVISSNEFALSDFEVRSLTFFEGDGILADEQDEHIPDTDSVVGDDNLIRFGHGSEDPNVVYIRNPEKELDFEVTRVKGKYAEVILGFIQHEDKRTPRKMRQERDW